MKVCIIGQGYIGLPTAALFSRNHCEVVGVDVSQEMIDNLNKGIIHIEEPGIAEIIKNAVTEYIDDVKSEKFPTEEHIFHATEKLY